MSESLKDVLPQWVVLRGMAEGILGGKISATDTAAKIPATALSYRKSIMLRNDSGQTAYIGSSSVTNAGVNGMIFKNGEVISIDAAAEVGVYVVLATGTGDIYYLEGS